MKSSGAWRIHRLAMSTASRSTGRLVRQECRRPRKLVGVSIACCFAGSVDPRMRTGDALVRSVSAMHTCLRICWTGGCGVYGSRLRAVVGA